MASLIPLSHLLGINTKSLSKVENYFFEAALFSGVCTTLKAVFREEYLNYFRIMKFTLNTENDMLETNLVRLIIKDILLSEDYTLEGLANYTHTHVDVINEIALGLNPNPSSLFVRRIIELHKMVKPVLYQQIVKKVLDHCEINKNCII